MPTRNDDHLIGYKHQGRVFKGGNWDDPKNWVPESARPYSFSYTLPEEEPKPEERGFFRALGDWGTSFTQGAVDVNQALSNVGGADNAVAQGLGQVSEAVGGLRSDEARLRREEHARLMKEAEQRGALAEIGQGFSNVADAPVDYMAQAAGSIVGLLPWMRGASLAAGGLGLSASAARVAGGAAVGAPVGVGATKGSQYQEVYDYLRSTGVGEAEARAAAVEAQAYKPENAGQHALAAGFGVVDLLTGGEASLAGIGTRAGKKWAARAVRRGAEETGTESLQAFHEKYAGNLAAIEAGDVERRPTQGAWGAATQEGLMGGGPGAIMGIAEGYQPSQAEIAAAQEQARLDAQAKLDADRQARQQEIADSIAQQQQYQQDLENDHQAKLDFVQQYGWAFQGDEPLLPSEFAAGIKERTPKAQTYDDYVKANGPYVGGETQWKKDNPKPKKPDVSALYDEYRKIWDTQQADFSPLPETPIGLDGAQLGFDFGPTDIYNRVGPEMRNRVGLAAMNAADNQMNRMGLGNTDTTIPSGQLFDTGAAPLSTTESSLESGPDHIAYPHAAAQFSPGGAKPNDTRLGLGAMPREGMAENPVNRAMGIAQAVQKAGGEAALSAPINGQLQNDWVWAKGVLADNFGDAYVQSLLAGKQPATKPATKPAATPATKPAPATKRAAEPSQTTTTGKTKAGKSSFETPEAERAAIYAELDAREVPEGAQPAIDTLIGTGNYKGVWKILDTYKRKPAPEAGAAPATKLDAVEETPEQAWDAMSEVPWANVVQSVRNKWVGTPRQQRTAERIDQLVDENNEVAPTEILNGLKAATFTGNRKNQGKYLDGFLLGEKFEDIGAGDVTYETWLREQKLQDSKENHKAYKKWRQNQRQAASQGVDRALENLRAKAQEWVAAGKITEAQAAQALRAINDDYERSVGAGMTERQREIAELTGGIVDDETLAFEDAAQHGALVRAASMSAGVKLDNEGSFDDAVVDTEKSGPDETSGAELPPGMNTGVEEDTTGENNATFQAAFNDAVKKGMSNAKAAQYARNLVKNLDAVTAPSSEGEQNAVVKNAQRIREQEVAKLANEKQAAKDKARRDEWRDKARDLWSEAAEDLDEELQVDFDALSETLQNRYIDAVARELDKRSNPSGHVNYNNLDDIQEVSSYVQIYGKPYNPFARSAKRGAGEAEAGTTENTTAAPQREKPETGTPAEQRAGKTQAAEGVKPQFSINNTQQGQDAAKLEANLKKLFNSPYFFNRAVQVVQDENDPRLPPNDRQSLSKTPGKVQGFYADGKVWIIAGNVASGKELAVLLHEVGVHMGMKNLLGPANYDKLIKQLEMWEIDAFSGDTTQEARLIGKARSRVERAKAKIAEMGEKPLTQAQEMEELLAYFVEEAVLAGINPSAIKGSGKLQQWFRTLWAAVKIAVRKLGMNPDKLTSQHVVDLAYGAARMELNAAWHGTAADFRKFDHKFMGSGEGAQAFGWGTYLAQRVGIGKGYWEADVGRKSGNRDAYDNTGFAAAPLSNMPYTKGVFAGDFILGATGEKVTIPDDATVTMKGGKPRIDVTVLRSDGYEDTFHTLFGAIRKVGSDAGVGMRGEVDFTKVKAEFDKSKPEIPEGNLMRVDTAIADEELLDWDKPLSEQSELTRSNIHRAMREAGLADGHEKTPRLTVSVRRTTPDGRTSEGAGARVDYQTGKQLYNLLEDKLGSDKAASEYLDSIGIKGIKFLDANSRGDQAALRRLRAQLDSQKREGASDFLIGVTKQAIENLERDVSNQTRNIVVFNDKNIHRIFSEKGADPESRLFSVAAPSVSDKANLPEKFKNAHWREAYYFDKDQGVGFVKMPSGEIVKWLPDFNDLGGVIRADGYGILTAQYSTKADDRALVEAIVKNMGLVIDRDYVGHGAAKAINELRRARSREGLHGKTRLSTETNALNALRQNVAFSKDDQTFALAEEILEYAKQIREAGKDSTGVVTQDRSKIAQVRRDPSVKRGEGYHSHDNYVSESTIGLSPRPRGGAKWKYPTRHKLYTRLQDLWHKLHGAYGATGTMEDGSSRMHATKWNPTTKSLERVYPEYEQQSEMLKGFRDATGMGERKLREAIARAEAKVEQHWIEREAPILAHEHTHAGLAILGLPVGSNPTVERERLMKGWTAEDKKVFNDGMETLQQIANDPLRAAVFAAVQKDPMVRKTLQDYIAANTITEEVKSGKQKVASIFGDDVEDKDATYNHKLKDPEDFMNFVGKMFFDGKLVLDAFPGMNKFFTLYTDGFNSYRNHMGEVLARIAQNQTAEAVKRVKAGEDPAKVFDDIMSRGIWQAADIDLDNMHSTGLLDFTAESIAEAVNKKGEFLHTIGKYHYFVRRTRVGSLGPEVPTLSLVGVADPIHYGASYDDFASVYAALLEKVKALGGVSASTNRMFSVAAPTTAQVIDAAPVALQEPLRVASDKISELVTKGVNYSTFTSHIVDSLRDVLPSAKKWYDAISKRETLRIGHEAKIDDIAEMADKLSKQQFNQTWSLIHDMTLANENGWAYKPTWKKEPVKVNTDLAKRWNTLSAEEQAFADAVFQNGYNTIRETQAALDTIADEVFADKLTNASPERKAKIEREKAKYKRMYSKKLSEIQGPYAPTRGVGSHITVGKSQLFVDTEKLAKAGDSKAADRLTELRGDPVHFRVAFSDSMTQAKQIEREYKNRFPVTTASSREYHSSNDVLPYQMFQTLRNKAEGDNGKFSRKLLNMIDDLYLQTLADTSARKSELKRVGAVDQNADRMMKAFLSKGKADAHHLAVLKTHREVSGNFRDMAQQAREYNLRDEKSMAYNELAQRYENSFNFDPSPTIGKLMNVTALWMLLTKPAYYLYNLTQPLMMAQPYLSQAHGYGKSMRELSRAYSDMSKTQRLFNMRHFDLTALPADVRAAMITLRDRGRIDITIAQDLGSRIHQSESALSKSAAKVTGFFRHAAQKTEMMNRIVTAAAAYRLAKAAGQSEQAALDYADKAVAHTQGDYSNFNAPRLLNETNFRKLITQFRKFQFIQIGLMLRMLKDSGFSTQEKRAATGAFMTMMGHHAVLAGAMGLPLMNVVAMAFTMMGDDDEPRDLELAMRDVFGKDAAGTFLQYGLPAALFNVNMSTNVGMGNTFSVVPFADIEWTRKGYESVVTSMMGPTFGLGAQAWDGVGKLGKGDYYGFLASISPGVVKSGIKALNEAANGVENTRGDVLVDPEELSFFATTAKALGFKTQDDAVRMLVRNSKFEFEKFFTSRTAELRNQYAKAYRDGDGSAMEEARNNWQELQAFKREYGFTVQPISNLLKAPMEQAKRERETAGGVQYDTATRAFVERYAEDEELEYE